ANGEQTQRWYADRGQPAGTTIAGIPYHFESLQFYLGISVGLNLNLTGQSRVSSPPPTNNRMNGEFEQLEEIDYEFSGNQFTIKWKPVAHASYDIYGKFAEKDTWIKLNKMQISDNYMVFAKTQLAGHFQFKVVIHLKEGYILETKILDIVINN
ncbi:MAG: hypothetical protein KAJ16_12930, partial [Calditrichia bacterium]|nr:hypothetical protein [Calditrichia bacterium]